MSESPTAFRILQSTAQHMVHDAMTLSMEQYRARWGESVVAKQTWNAIVNRPPDAPEQVTRLAIYRRHERHIKAGRPLAYIDHRPGKRDQIVVNDGYLREEELREMVDERRHYSQDVHPRTRPKRDLHALLMDREEAVNNIRRGRTVYGATTTKAFWSK